MKHQVPSGPAGDRLAIHALIDAYARCADRREADQQRALFTEDARFAVYLNGARTEATEVLRGRDALTPVFEALKQDEVTMHLNGQSYIELGEREASAETYCVGHHIFTTGGVRKIMIANLRYEDTFRTEAGAWRFAERDIFVEFSETRPLGG